MNLFKFRGREGVASEAHDNPALENDVTTQPKNTPAADAPKPAPAATAITPEQLAAAEERAAAAERRTAELEADASKNAVASAAAQAATIAKMCADAGLSVMSASLIEKGASVEDAQKLIADAGKIKAEVAWARQQCAVLPEGMADGYIAAGTPIEQVRSDLIEKMAAADNAIGETVSLHQPGGTGGGAPVSDPTGQVEIDALWQNRIDKRYPQQEMRH